MVHTENNNAEVMHIWSIFTFDHGLAIIPILNILFFCRHHVISIHRDSIHFWKKIPTSGPAHRDNLILNVFPTTSLHVHNTSGKHSKVEKYVIPMYRVYVGMLLGKHSKVHKYVVPMNYGHVGMLLGKHPKLYQHIVPMYDGHVGILLGKHSKSGCPDVLVPMSGFFSKNV